MSELGPAFRNALNGLAAGVCKEFMDRAYDGKDEIRVQSSDMLLARIAAFGTDTDQNAADPFGDGDQKELRGRQAQTLREIWSAGGDFFAQLDNGQLSRFELACFLGAFDEVRRLLDNTEAPAEVLEKRICVIRQTPLITAIMGMRCVPLQASTARLPVRIDLGTSIMTLYERPKHEDCVRLLLERGARICARDIAGHTCVHFAVGGMATEGQIALLPLLVKFGADVNSQNRFGGLPFHEAIMTANKPAIRALLKQGARIDIEDADGTTPLSMASKFPAILAMIGCQGAKNDRARMMHCADCGTSSNKKCNGCCLVVYCSTECQKAHWRTHKTECKAAQSKASNMGCIEVRPTPRVVPCSITCNKTGKTYNVQTSGDVEAPKEVDKDGCFVVKVQADGPEPLIYNQARDVCLEMTPDHEHCDALRGYVKQYGVYGLKIYVRARVSGGSLHLLMDQLVKPKKW